MIPLAAETVQSTSLAFESVDHVHGGHCLSLGMLGVRHSITDNVFQEYFQNTTGFFVDEARDTLDTATASKTTDSWLGYALDVVTKDLSVTLSTSFSETFSSLSSSGHVLR